MNTILTSLQILAQRASTNAVRTRNFINSLLLAAMVLPATGKLLHRYDFRGSGTVCNDDAGKQEATILVGAKLSSDGKLARFLHILVSSE